MRIPENINESGRKWLKTLSKEYQFDKTLMEVAFQGAACLDRIRMAQEAIREHGLLVDTEGGLKCNPAAAVERDNKVLFCRICRDLKIFNEVSDAEK